MSELPTYFNAFLRDVRPTSHQREEMRDGCRTLRTRVQGFERLKDIYISDFLQGSYRRSTAIRPVEGERSDVDLVVVTNLDSHDVTPAEALERFVPFLEQYYSGKWTPQGRSIGIELSYVKLDLVVTAAPSEAAQVALQWGAVRTLSGLQEILDWRLNRYWVPLEHRDQLDAESRLLEATREAEWQAEPLLIPDRDAWRWQKTHPLAQIAWTHKKNAATNGHYVNVVKALKWWWRVQHPDLNHPKGYPLEHIVGDTCPDGIESVAEGIVATLESVRDRFAGHVAQGTVPTLQDRGTEQDVLMRLSSEDFKRFHDEAGQAASLAREAFKEPDRSKSAKLWRQLLGARFPEAPDGGAKTGLGGSGAAALGGFTERREESEIPRGRFA